MVAIDETVARIAAARTWDQRVAQIRLVPQHHGIGEHAEIYARVAREAYVPHLAPDFAYVHASPFYSLPVFETAYAAAAELTADFTRVEVADLVRAIERNSLTLLVFRTILGLTREEFAHSTTLAGQAVGVRGLSSSKVDSMERSGTAVTGDQARVAAETIARSV